MCALLQIADRDVTVTDGLIRTAWLEQEWYEDVANPEDMIARLKQRPVKADMFTFWQRLPEVTPKYHYYMEWDEIAALPVTSYDHWWSTQIKSRTRGLIRKAAKQGVVVKEAEFTDEFVRGMTSIFNETPIRQGKPFWHFGKDFETVKRQFSTYLFRETLIGAYFNNELIGFIMLGFAGNYAVTGQIISKLSHRAKAPNNNLMAKAVEICAREKIPYLVYLNWGDGSLAEFKRRNGFQRTLLPRYYVPLTASGEIALRLGLHRGFAGLIPQNVKSRLKRLRSIWYRGTCAVKYGWSHAREAAP